MTMNDEYLLDELRRWIFFALGLSALVLAGVKVRNELTMTQMYERQAVALERIASALDGQYAKH